MPAGNLGSPKVSGDFRSTYEPNFRTVPRNSKFYSSNDPPRLLFNAHQGPFVGWQGGRNVWLTTTSSNDHDVHKDTPTFTLRLFRQKVCAETRCSLSLCDNTWSKAVRTLIVLIHNSSCGNFKRCQLQ